MADGICRRAAVFLLLAIVLSFVSPAAAVPEGGEAELWYFWGEGCRKCASARAWLEDLKGKYPALTVHEAEVWKDPQGQRQYVEKLKAMGAEASVVPAFVAGQRVWLGFNSAYAAEIEEEIRLALAAEGGGEGAALARNILDLGPLGSIYLAGQPLLLLTALIAFADGFNPCSLWVLTVLLAMILSSGSRSRVMAVGITFLLVTGLVYGLFISGFFGILSIVNHLYWLRVAIVALALVFAVINIKDFFFFKKGVSLTIPEAMKKNIYRGGREIRKERSLPAMLMLTATLAAGTALVELPCTAGLPMLWASLLSNAAVSGGAFFLLLLVYLAVFLSIAIAILIAAVATMRTRRLQEVHGRTLKLIGGIIMAIMGVGMALNL
ncbi:MAG: thioredoxin [Firmicutes bacterium]|nr:thioredoxin [Bacillota bacterium]HOB35410.1 thioredoxin [Bacillota bacterium]HPZ91221.1 thioredoxin [Bacillota bacterium]HQE02361.1 thioredoxin [Bacillota bacterium]